MQVEISRRKFLQGSVALSIIGGSSTFATGIVSKNEEKQTYEVPTLCEICVNKCALYAKVENGKVVKLDPNPHFPKSKNMLCARGNSAIELLYDEDRLKYPLIRVGKRGEGVFKRVTWDEAMEFIKNTTLKILDEEEDNRSTFGFCAGEGMAEETFRNFYSGFGSTNFVNHSTICLMTAVSGYKLTIGTYGFADLENVDYIIMAGANRAEAIVTPDTMDLFKRTKNRGAKLIVVDPRFTTTASKADRWLAIKPGSDLAFVLAMTYFVLKNELYNKEFVEKNFNNFDEYKEHILSSGYTPKWAETLTNIKAKDIEITAKEFMQYAPKSIYYPGRRSTFAKNDFQLRRAQAIFTALGGGIDCKGGICYGKSLPLNAHNVPTPLYFNAKTRIEANSAAIVGANGSWVNWRNMIAEKKSPYPIRGMFIYKQNPMQCLPNIEKTKQMFESMDLVITIDTMPSDTVMMSDVVLPECTYLERCDPVKSFGGIEPSIALRNQVIKPMYESKPLIEIMALLTNKISKDLFENSYKYDDDLKDTVTEKLEELQELYADKTPQDLNIMAKNEIYKNEYDLTKAFLKSQEELNHEAVDKYEGAIEQLKSKGVFYPNMSEYFEKISVNEYRYYPENKKSYSVRDNKFDTPSKKIECKLESLEKKGIASMPTWESSYELNPKNDEFRFIFGRHAQHTQSATTNNKLLRDLLPENYVWINKRVAKDRGYKFGDLLEITSAVGKCLIKAYPTEKIAPDTIFFIHGFGLNSKALNNAYGYGASDSQIIEDITEPVFGSAAAHETFVTIKKV